MRIGPALAIVGALVALGAVGAKYAQTPPGAMSWEKPIAPGVVYREELDYQGHRTVNSLRISLRSNAVRATVALYGHTTYEPGNPTGRGPVSKIVSDERGIGAVNGDFFSMASGPSGEPLGIAVRDGRLLSTPSNRVAFGWGPVDAAMSTASFSGSVVGPDGEIKIDGLNRNCPKDQITLDTPDAGLALSESPCTGVLLRFRDPVWSASTIIKGRVVSAFAGPPKDPIRPDEAVLIARGNKADVLAKLRPGANVTVTLRTAGFDWERIDTVIGGGPALVRNGAIQVDAQQEGFAAEFYDRKHPRTAIGRTADNDIWLVTVDGRQETGDGMTLQELAALMQRLGCVDAMNLDGGGSTTMNVMGVTVNRPSDGQERPIADAVVLVGPRPFATDEKPQIQAPSELDMGQDVPAKVTAPGTAQIANLDVIWGCTGAAVIDQGGLIHPLHPGAANLTAYYHGRLLQAQLDVR